MNKNLVKQACGEKYLPSSYYIQKSGPCYKASKALGLDRSTVNDTIYKWRRLVVP